MALYQHWNIEEYKGNPLIEALPKFLKHDDFMISVMQKPSFDEEERYHNDMEKIIYIDRLDACVIPCSEFYSVYKKAYKLVLKAYAKRNPLSPKTDQIAYSIASGERIPHPQKKSNISASTVFVTGLSGRGKSLMIEVTLEAAFPEQIISHTEYNGEKINIEQLVYVKLNCPGDASRKELCMNFFRVVDEATGYTNYEETNAHSKLSIGDLERNIKKVCILHHIALIVIDELQNLSIARSGGAKQAMQFFESIVTDTYVSLIFIGTYDCFDIYDGSFKTARKMSQDGVVDLMQLGRDDHYWLSLVRALWNAQWVQEPIQLFEKKDGINSDYNKTIAKDMLDTIYYCTQGVTVCTTTLIKHANAYAIERGLKTIDAQIVLDVYKTEFKLLYPALEALRNSDYSVYDELMPIADRIKNMRMNPNQECFYKNEEGSHSHESMEDQKEVISIAPDKLQQKKRKNESAEDCLNRLKTNGFFCSSFEDLFKS